MKRFLILLLLLSQLFVPLANAKDVVSHTFASLVRIESFNAETGEPTACTGFMVAPRRALTASHCIQDDAGFKVDGEDALVLKKDGYFALVSAGTKPYLRLAKKVKLQEQVTTFGYAWGDMFVFSRRVAIIKDGDFAMDGPLAPGMSGGPTVNQAGEVVGLNQAANNVIGIVCGAGEISAFLSASPK